MAHDLLVTGGTLVDGIGGVPRRADVAVTAGRVVAVGYHLGSADVEIDADGCIVTPGFVDLHTHFDAQIGWDPHLTPSSLHGVTTALIGNCGMGFAPVRPGDGGEIAAMMQAVEDIPAGAILAGLPWDWETYGEYLASLERLHPAVNVAGLVGHVAVRRYVLGDDAVEGHPDARQAAAMAAAVSEAVGAGAVGVSTSRYLGHVLPDGRLVPGTLADRPELLALAGAVGDGGLLQLVINEQAFRAEIELIRGIALDAGVRLLLTVAVGDQPSNGAGVCRLIDDLVASGVEVTGMIAPRSGGVVAGLFGSLLPWRTPAWNRLVRLAANERLAALQDDAVRQHLIEEGEAHPPFLPAEWFFPLGIGVDHYVATEGSLAELAAAAGESPAACFVRLSLESDGQALFTGRMFNRCYDAIDQALESDRVLPGLGDAGAHVGQMLDAGWTTFWLAHWVRDRGRFSLADGVRRITSAPADVIGATEVGRLVVGARADVNVIDLARLRPLAVEVVADFPGGAKRFVQSAEGYRATVVNGEVLVADDRLVGGGNGCVLRVSR